MPHLTIRRGVVVLADTPDALRIQLYIDNTCSLISSPNKQYGIIHVLGKQVTAFRLIYAKIHCVDCDRRVRSAVTNMFNHSSHYCLNVTVLLRMNTEDRLVK